MVYRTRSAPQWFGIALFASLVSLALSLVPERHAPGTAAFLLYSAAVAVSAGYGGILPGVLATALCGIGADLLLLHPGTHALSWTDWRHQPLSLFTLVGLFISALAEVLHAAYRKAEDAREDAEAAHRRVTFLSESSVVLDSSLDFSQTLCNLAKRCVPRLADWCAIHLSEEGDASTPVAVAHVDPSCDRLVTALGGRYPLDAQGRHPLQRTLQTGATVVHLEIPDAALVAAARDSEHLQMLRDLRIRSYVCVPLAARGATLGAIIFVSSAGRRYLPPDVALAEELARRASVAVENARLYRSAQQEIEERIRTEAELREKQEEVAALNRRLKRSVTETHHRVKNNLQMVAAMVDMLRMDPEAASRPEELERLVNHIRALAAVHDILTLGSKVDGDSETVSARQVLDKLLPLMQQAAGDRVIRYEVDDTVLPARKGTSLALMLNELVSNALKHGNRDVEVDMRRRDIAAVLRVEDDGPGFPVGFDPKRAANTGLELVDSLSRWDLGGEVRFSNRPEGGARVEVVIPLKG